MGSNLLSLIPLAAERVLELIAAIPKTSDIARSNAAAAALCQMEPVSPNIQSQAYQQLLKLLVSDIILVWYHSFVWDSLHWNSFELS